MATSTSAAPKVSIGMPVYNGAAYISKALDSLLAQTFSDFELIISDNASIDGTDKICRRYAARDARVRYIRQDVNRGASANFSFVLDEARGEYFMWAASDDIWLPDFISECLTVISADATIGFAAPTHRVISRLAPIFDRWYIANFDFITDENPVNRVLTYSSMSFHTHKDNLFYCLWSRKAIVRILKGIVDSPLHKAIFAGAMNDYALALYKGGYVNKVLWHKTYSNLPPGHPLMPIVGNLARLWRLIRGRPRGDRPRVPTPEEHFHELQVLLNLAGFNEKTIDKVVNNYREYVK